MPGSAWNWRRTSLITFTAALVTAPMASAENQNTSIAPSRPPTKTSGFEMSTAASGEPSAATSSRYAEKRRNAASAADPIAYPLVSAFVVLPTASSRSVRRRDRKSTRLNSSHRTTSYAVFCLKKKKKKKNNKQLCKKKIVHKRQE